MEIIQRKQEKKWGQTGTAGKNSFLTLKTLDSWSLSRIEYVDLCVTDAWPQISSHSDARAESCEFSPIAAQSC